MMTESTAFTRPDLIKHRPSPWLVPVYSIYLNYLLTSVESVYGDI